MNRALEICGLPSNICQHVNSGILKREDAQEAQQDYLEK